VRANRLRDSAPHPARCEPLSVDEKHPDEPIPAGQIFNPTLVMGKADPRQRMIFYQYRSDEARRILKESTQQIAKGRRSSPGGPR
jgi:hypothetical protein